ncbi:MAG TPA: tetratricopeptide repeat protein [Polyangiaceae bacterium]|nr:tetratricopeptide repeat protein [Polyangiaceae bacterium]
MTKKSGAVDLERLQSDVEWALQRGLGPRDLVPMLERLYQHAPRGSAAACFAGTELAEVLLTAAPWRSSVLAREVLKYEDTDRAWAVLGLGLTMLGHYRSAKRAFSKALAHSPQCSSYAHNLGHLLDAALGRPQEGLPWLARAHAARPGDEEIAASYAHALVRLGRTEDARRVLDSAMGPTNDAAAGLIERFIAEGDAPGME